jgi:hypothetical protein
MSIHRASSGNYGVGVVDDCEVSSVEREWIEEILGEHVRSILSTYENCLSPLIGHENDEMMTQETIAGV